MSSRKAGEKPRKTLRGALALLLLALCPPLALGANLGVERVDDALPFFDGDRHVRYPRDGDEFPPLRALLSRSRYWAQDGHLDVVAQLDEENPQGELRVRLLGANGQALSSFQISPLPGPRFIFYPAIPDALANGGQGEIEIAWVRGGQTLGEHREAFRVEVFDEPAERSGRIPVSVPNAPGIGQRGVPATVGVPFPRGALEDIANLRLVDEAGSEVPVQVKETARWSRFGSVKWALCDFTVDLDGGPRELFLEYGPGVSRAERPAISVEESGGFPVVEAGRLRFDGGLWFDAAGDGNFVQVLGEQSLSGAFIEHEDGRFYRAPIADRYEVEEHGPEKVVLRREGWYQEEGGDREFCKYIIRYVIHRDSPLLRVFHTWVFTGDGNRDRIRNMGWEFALPDGFERRGFLTAFGDEAAWEDADYLLQWDHDGFDLAQGGNVREFPGGRAPGVAAARGDGMHLYFGAQHFWQNYPSELEFRDGSLWFHNWPRHGKPARHIYDPEQLSESEFRLNAVQNRYAHEGKLLSFRVPQEYVEGPIWAEATSSGRASHWDEGQPESINAQGVSRTEEMWLYLEADPAQPDNAARLLEGLDDESLRAVADPAWVAQSGAFYEIHHQDWENYPEAERSFELMALAPGLWRERLGLYGMWIYGDMAVWGGVSLDTRTPPFYRAFLGTHHGWPYSWIPFARSGDPRLLNLAKIQTRQMTDVTFCNYADEVVDRRLGENRHQRLGWYGVSLIPWARYSSPETRGLLSKCDFLWYAHYLTGCGRTRDIALLWAEATKEEEPLSGRGPITAAGGRGSVTLLKSYLETYEATFDPWFLVAAHAIADGHRNRLRRGAFGGHFHQPGDREYMRYTGAPDYVEVYRAYMENYADHRTGGGSWGAIGSPMAESYAFGWLLTGEEYYLRRAAHYVDWIAQAVYDADEPWHTRGQYTYGHGTPLGTSWGLHLFPAAMATLERAGRRPEPIGNRFALRARFPAQEVALRKEAGRPLPMELGAKVVGERFLGLHRVERDHTVPYEIVGPDGEIALAGDWTVHEMLRLEVPADAAAGDYRLRVFGSGLDVPVSDVDQPEVIVLADGERMGTSHREGRYWFMVPEGVEEFYVDFGFPHSRGRISVWNPDGQRAWNFNFHQATHADMNSVRAEVRVPPEHAGRLWRITVPGHGAGNFEMDPQIPPVYATERSRWFMPENMEEND